ncbi:response regulator transcription factor [Dehalobacter sp. DCM]|uniref:response regulator transcription factor n=1 Tax=Dehalobacter sp. DCM TaxID=2907827 RepID=UPI003081E8D6|nr:response regulator transcription factor [Dehalobacter sp. DCM]
MGVPKILIADDDHEIVNLLSDSLEDEGFEVVKAYDGKEVLRKLAETDLSLVILDVMMPEIDGLEVCRKVRNDIAIPIIILSAKDREIDKVIGLEVGADDYITKPFSIYELVARVNAHLRRERRSSIFSSKISNMLEIGNLSINKETFDVWVDGKKIDLSTREFQILVYLAENHNRVLSREKIYEAIWGDSTYGDINTVTVHIKNLRSKIDQHNQYIRTVWGIGYKFTGGLQ